VPRPQKRSVTLQGHRTSVTLEAEFWGALKDIAKERSQSTNELIAEIDNARISGENIDDIGLSSAIRIFILKHIQA
jgi:predicted DNA-binding ribbon-helix-helix protein